MNKKNNYTVPLIIVVFIIIVVITGLLTNYKQETLVCSKSKDYCLIEKTNLLNMKSEKKLVKFSDISDIGYLRQKIKGNRYAKGYTEYLLTFNLKNNDRIIIFSESYYDKAELDRTIKDLNTQFNLNNDIIRVKRN